MRRGEVIRAWAAAMMLALPAAAAAGGEPWVTVNGRPLSVLEFRRHMRWSLDLLERAQPELIESRLGAASAVQNAGLGVLRRMIERELIEQEAARLKVRVEAEEVDAQVDRLLASYGKDHLGRPRGASQRRAALAADLEKDRLTEAALREIIAQDLRLSRVVELRVLPRVLRATGKELERAFARLKAIAAGEAGAMDGLSEEEGLQYVQFAAQLGREHSAQVRLSHIFLEAKSPKAKAKALSRARKLEERLKGGADFGELARAESMDAATAELGGDLGWVRRGWADAAVEEAAFALEVGGRSGPVETPRGLHLLFVREKKAGEPWSYSALVGRLSGFLHRLTVKREFQALLGRLSREADIRVRRLARSPR